MIKSLVPMIKGSILKLGKAWYIEKCGSEAKFEAVLEKNAPPILQTAMKQTLIPMQWYPVELYHAQYKFVTTTWGKDAFPEAAAGVAFKDLSTAMKFFIKLGTPSFIASKFPNSWKHYFSAGSFSIANCTPKSLDGILEDAEDYGPAGCQGSMGWTRMALEYSGAKNVKIEHPECVFHGGKKCLLKFSWE